MHLHESRLRRQGDRDLTELRFLQTERRRLVVEAEELAAYARRKVERTIPINGIPVSIAAFKGCKAA